MGSPEKLYGKGRQTEVSSAEWVLPQDGLVPVRAYGDQRNLHVGQLLQPPHVPLGGFRKVAELPGVRQILLPPLQLLVDGHPPPARPVVDPYSEPRSRICWPSSSKSSVGNGPPPTRVM